MIDVPHNLSSGEYSVGDASGTVLEMAQNRLAIAFAKEAAAEYGMSADDLRSVRKDQRGRHRARAEAQRELRPLARADRRAAPPDRRRRDARDHRERLLPRRALHAGRGADRARGLHPRLRGRARVEDRPLRELAGGGAVPSGRRVEGARGARLGDGAQGDPRRQRTRAGVRPLPRPADARLHLRLDDGALHRQGRAGPLGAAARRPDGGDGAQDHRPRAGRGS